ncbi:hypothetical protein E4T56_gene10580 [Termitomyces sp. T112]|nr:hypothetical protein E4T56_gene10580 [Termitomyces sp. T112]KAH0579875.1 hypothetical protein H2248_002703 [Termitomyces sp. 'cryptogamus']KNZ77330.1 hypothetical protein J132_05758 [Termitomyces sp. J132]
MAQIIPSVSTDRLDGNMMIVVNNFDSNEPPPAYYPPSSSSISSNAANELRVATPPPAYSRWNQSGFVSLVYGLGQANPPFIRIPTTIMRRRQYAISDVEEGRQPRSESQSIKTYLLGMAIVLSVGFGIILAFVIIPKLMP